MDDVAEGVFFCRWPFPKPRLMHCWDDGDKHQALVQETLGHFQRFWPSEWPALEIQVCNS